MINNLATYRKKAKLSQKVFAEKLEIGMVTLSKWENPDFDLKRLQINTVIKICEILNVGFYELIEIKEGK